MKKIDLKKEFKPFYTASVDSPKILHVPKCNFLTVDGSGDPNTSKEFQQAAEALYGVAYTLKFMIKKELKIDYPIMALEGLWWMDEGKAFDMERKELWKWRLMIMLPSILRKRDVTKAIGILQQKKNVPALPLVHFGTFKEGMSAQILHIGPYAEEARTIESLQDFVRTHGYQFSGTHHEIYMSDPRRTAPEKIRTILRHPIQRMKAI